MKSTSNSSRALDRYSLIEPLEARIAPAAATVYLPANPSFVTVTTGSSLLVKAGQVLTSGAGGSGAYLLYVAQGEVLVHTTDLNQDGSFDYNEITGLSVGNGTILVSFVDIHGDIVTDLNPNGTLDHGGLGDIVLDSNITEIDMRSLTTNDFTGTASQSAATLVNAHLALSNYSIFGSIYAGGGLGSASNSSSGLVIDPSGATTQENVFTGTTGGVFYQPTVPYIGSIYVGSAVSGQPFSFGASGSSTDIFGNLLTFNPATGEAGAGIYNVSAAATGDVFNIGTLHAGDGGFNAPGGSIENVALSGNTVGAVQLIAGNAGAGTTGHVGGSILNFSAANIINSEVLLQSGTGGVGLTGAGGNAGQITLAPGTTAQINSHLVLNYGSGGNGYTAGGAGGGSTSGTFVVPDGKVTTAETMVSTMHSIGSIGTNEPIEFTSSGYSDFVFSTINPNQIVVGFGGNAGSSTVSEFGFDAASYMYLNAPGQVESIVVGDFTGSGHPDIAVAAGTGSYAGIYVYLSEYSPKTGAFDGFSAPLFTPLPSLEPYGYYYTSAPVTKLIAGDFAGNGVEGLAVLTQQTVFQTKLVDSVLVYLNGETSKAHPGGSGYFYGASSGITGVPFENFVDFGDNGHFDPLHSIFEVTALQTYTPTTPTYPLGLGASNGHDVIIEANLGAKALNVIDDSFGIPETVDTIALGKVDTNRQVGPTYIALANFQVLGVAVTQDVTNPNIADLVALSQAPADFLETLQGTGTGVFNITSGAGVDQAGINFTGGSADPVSLYAVPNLTGSAISDVAILDYDGSGADSIYVVNFTTNMAGLTTGAISGTEVWALPSPAFGRNTNTVAWGVYYPHPIATTLPGSGPNAFGFISANPLENYPDDQDFYISQPLSAFAGGITDQVAPFKDAGLFFNAGAGGSSQSGAGGAGGSFGQSLKVTGSGSTITATGTLSIQLPMDPSFEGIVQFNGGLNAGNGGNGFGNGGAGGNISGVSVTYETGTTTLSAEVLMTAGTGGESLTGAGGAGGSESQLFIFSGDFFQAGSGGLGIVGGAGGSVLGNPQTGLFTSETNSYDADITVLAGSGAPGVTGGGHGGNIIDFTNEFPPIIGGIGGLLDYQAGSGGDAVAGKGGDGGSVINSSPSNLDNNLVGDIYLIGGSGGNGLSGGNGGAITTFVQTSTINEPPTSFTIISGFGGNATLGNGGAGGGISGITVSASGLDVGYNRMVAGSGGNSAGGIGGAGGSLSTITTASVAADTQDVAAAGAGGQGLTEGGAGGSVTNVSMDAGASSGSTSGKVVVIAGDGGASTSVKPNAHDPLGMAHAIAFSIGGVNGAGGAGGSIIDFTQPTSVSTHVDLIAGNGGATLNHSVIAGNASFDNSGKGGNIENVAVTGSIGNSDPTVAIVSYNNIFTGVTSNQVFTGTTMQDFVNNYIVAPVLDGTQLFMPMNDTIGNVGLVAGAAGRVEGATPSAATVASTDGINGSVSNVHAENIMSMIAGNVDQVDLIQNLSDFGVIAGGILGANKQAYYDPVTETLFPDEGTLGNLNYLSTSGALVNSPLPGGGELIDGAIIAKNIPVLESARQF